MRIEKYVNKYPVSKTLRFELKPIGPTKDRIYERYLENDIKRSEDYQKVKEIIDDYYRHYIDASLRGVSLDWQKLFDMFKTVKSMKYSDAEYKVILKKYNDIQTENRKAILQGMKDQFAKVVNMKSQNGDDHVEVEAATEDEDGEDESEKKKSTGYKDLFKSKLLTDIIPAHLEEIVDDNRQEKMALLKSFNKFTTYFSGFWENRKNVFSEKAISTSITFRIVHDNFPIFCENVDKYRILKSRTPEVCSTIEAELDEYLNGRQLDEVFALTYFNEVITQEGIDNYNTILGGVSTAAGEKKTRGVNERINLYCQKEGDNAKYRRNEVKMKRLKKQILSDAETKSFAFDEITSDLEVKEKIEKFFDEVEAENVLPELHNAVEQMDELDQEKIYIGRNMLPKLSNDFYNKWEIIGLSLDDYAREMLSRKNERVKWLNQDAFSIHDIQYAIDQFANEYLEEGEDATVSLVDKLKNDCLELIDSVQKISAEKIAILDVINQDTDALREKSDNSSNVADAIKAILDEVQGCYNKLKMFSVSKETDRDQEFYTPFEEKMHTFDLIIPLYNTIRNYVTQEPFSKEKIKVNFDDPTLAAGWDRDKEKDNGAIILRKDGTYYLAIMETGRRLSISFPEVQNGAVPTYEKLEYKQFQDVKKMIPKCTVRRGEVEEHFKNSDEPYILFTDKFERPLEISREVFNMATDKGTKPYQVANMEKQGYQRALNKWLYFCMDFLQAYKSTKEYDYSEIRPADYNRLDDFYNDLDRLLYKMHFFNVDQELIENYLKSGQIMLFKISNKDYSPGSTGNKNLHTMYWEALFSEENLENIRIKLNGQAMLFFRERSIDSPAIHRKGEKMVNRIAKNGERIPEKIHDELVRYANEKLEKGELSGEAKSLLDRAQITTKPAKYDIVKDKRYTEDKFLFHVPITLSFGARDDSAAMNEAVRRDLCESEDQHIIGIDRGERHLLYVCVIDGKGNIVHQESLNMISGVDYQNKLDVREKERDLARKSWGKIGKIKDLKTGYLSQAVHCVCRLVEQYNAIVVLENLNIGFKRSRTKVEKQVYQKFEKMLIDKLNYLVFKERNPAEIGGVLAGYQLTKKFQSFEKIGSQSGILFYVQAAYTSKIDPATGFADVLDKRGLTNVEKKKEFFASFEGIRYCSDEDLFEFSINFSKKTLSTAAQLAKPDWKIYSYSDRIVYSKKGTKETTINLTPALKALFEGKGINYLDGEDTLPRIMGVSAEKSNAPFFDGLYCLFRATVQLRNSSKEKELDYIVSPVKDKDARFFDSRNGEKNMPENADANGAYHIALKGRMIEKRLKAGEMGPNALRIDNKSWFSFLQEELHR